MFSVVAGRRVGYIMRDENNAGGFPSPPFSILLPRGLAGIKDIPMDPSRLFDKPLDVCPACGGKDIVPVLRDFRDNEIYKCRECALQFLNPQYSDEDLTRFYSSYIRGDLAGDEIRKAVVEHEVEVFSSHNLYLGRMEAALGRAGTLFDIGCGHGHLMEAALRRGWQASGYDVECGVTEQVSRRLSVPVRCGDFFQVISSMQGRFDAVTLHQVLEHLKDPAKYLSAVHGIIRDGGLLFVAVPNIASISNRVKFALDRLGLRKKSRRGAYYTSDHHILYFSPAPLIRLVERLGFEAVEIRGCDKTTGGGSKLKRWILENTYEKTTLGSSFFIVARKKHLP